MVGSVTGLNCKTKTDSMMRITKVYTKTGDKGKTRLAGGQRVWKDSPRVEAYGTVDELNAVIGVIRVLCTDPACKLVDDELGWVQNKLFDVGGLLATAPGQSFDRMPQVTPEDTARLERLMDFCQRELPPLKEFILPGGGTLGAHLHLARTICRRAERRSVTLMRREEVMSSIVVFLNRLSDALFVLARWVAKRQGEAEVYWQRETKSGFKKRR
jgi:cob(I)alamin adenosyltransferase